MLFLESTDPFGWPSCQNCVMESSNKLNIGGNRNSNKVWALVTKSINKTMKAAKVVKVFYLRKQNALAV